MQAVKEKLSDMRAMRKAKAEAKAEEQAEKELAKARVEVAHEVRLAREAEAAMDLHVNKAAEKVVQHEANHPQHRSDHQLYDEGNQGRYGRDTTGRAYSNDQTYGAGAHDPYGRDASNIGSTTTTTGYTMDRTGGPPTNNNIL